MFRRFTRLRRRSSAVFVTAAITAVPLVVGTLPAQAQTEPAPKTAYEAKSESKVRTQFADQKKVTFWVGLKKEADVASARSAKGKTAKARALYRTKTAFAKESQAGVVALAKEAGATYKSFWISNTVKITGTEALAKKIAARSDVATIEADDPVVIPDPLPGTKEVPQVNSVEWGVDRINAPKVWDDLGIRGEGIVIGSIDTGVDYQHPALAAKYRGLKADGSYDHAYNWFDPGGSCPTSAPCDNNSHGTHTMGTMVGDDGAGNQIGVAPGAQWIAAKGCGTSSCSQEDLLASGQWMVAPTEASGANPRPDLAPDVINNSWGADIIDTWYQDTVQSWRDAGIFPAFSNGNNGTAGCNTAGSPGAYSNTYASGAFDSNNAIANFSSRGTGVDGIIKPNIAAPGVNIRSATPGGGYAVKSGTSMASPHTAATVALMWAASPALRGDVAATEKILDDTAIDTNDTSCGGTADFNNVWGEGRLDAYAAVNATPRGALGAIGGKISSGDAGLAGATVALDGPMKSTLTTGADGSYALPKVLVGDYKVTVSKFGYRTTESTVTITENGTATKDFTLEKAADATLTGTVKTEAGVEARATVVVQGTPVKTVSAADGTYSVTLPVGTYNIAVTPVSRCATASTVRVELTASAGKDFDLGSREDGFGTTCQVGTGAFPTGDTKLTIASPTAGSAPIDLPFPVALYGKTYRSATATIKGVLAFGTTSVTSANIGLPATSVPNGALYPFWDNLQIDTSSSTSGVYWATQGTAPHRSVVVEWRDLQFISAPAQRISFSAVIGEDGSVSYHYKDIDSGSYENGSSATIGVEDHTGTDALQYSYNEPVVANGLTVSFSTAKSAVIAGTVTDDNDGKPVEGATVKVGQGGSDIATGTTGADGSYLLQVPADSKESAYDVAVSADHYSGGTAAREVKARGIAVADAVLKTALVTTSADKYTVVIPAEQERTRTLTLSNAGTATPYSVKEKSGASWVTIAATSGVLAKGAQQKVGLVFDTKGATPGTVLDGTLLITSESGRAPVVEVPLKIVVPAYQAALDTGATGSITDLRGDTWGPDQAYKAGSYGYIGTGGTPSTNKDITGTNEQELYRTARTGAQEYRFDNVPNGVYRIELGFAEVSGTKPGARVVDLLAEGKEYVSNLDIALEAGTFTALDKTITVKVTDGQLNVRLSAIHGKSLVNSIRVSQRPDLES
ncbi:MULTISPECIES: S8 family serine peptidase [unclassified Streptomyces]|uniref:S8 family serine peptidase n=1 Tax=unclassified Streptomyces TaxID=2593676 RepID=UPI0033ED48DA